MNRKDKYKITVSPEMIQKAFTSYEIIFIYSIYNQYFITSSELDEFVLMKQLIKQACDNNAMKVVTVADPTASESNAKAFIKAVKIVSGDMVFANLNNNAYLTSQLQM